MTYTDWLGNEIVVGSPVLYAISQGHFAKLVWGEVLEIIPEGERHYEEYLGRSFKLKVQPYFENVDVVGAEKRWGRTIEWQWDAAKQEGQHVRVMPKPAFIKNVEKVTVFPLPTHFRPKLAKLLDGLVENFDERWSAQWGAR